MSSRSSIRHAFLLIFVLAEYSFQLSNCNVHTYGPPEFSHGSMFDGHELFSRSMSESERKDYALFYKYRAPSMDGLIGYAVLNSSAPSSGSITANSGMDFNEERVVEANADIQNATNFTVGIKLFGFSSGINLNSLRFLRPRGFIKPRTFAIMCGVIPNRRRQQKRSLEFGKRTDGDFLIRFERHEAMTEASAFPSYTFDFFDGGININYVKLTIDSPTAIVFSNKIFLDKYKFFAKIFGTNLNTFTTEMHIYGTKV